MPDSGEPDARPALKYIREIQTALKIRLTEERLLALFAAGKLFGTVHTCIGQEMSAVAVARALRPDDYVFSNHRCHGHFLAARDNVEGLIAELMGKSTGVCAGLGGSQHLCQDGFFSNGIQGGICAVAAGLALAQQLKGSGGIAVVFIGDGTLGEGALYETLNLASKWALPLLVVLENNGIAQSTLPSQTLAGEIAGRFAAFGIPTARSNTWDYEQLFEEMQRSVTAVRTNGSPRFHQVDTYRLMAHSKGDDTRPKAEVESSRERDPLNRIIAARADEPWLQEVRRELATRIEGAIERAEAATVLELRTPDAWRRTDRWRTLEFERERVIAGIRGALGEALAADERVILFGEDVESPYGGAFRATLGLSDAHPGRVRNTPISEGAIVGLANGLALAGRRPVVEIMFGDFLTLATDQWVNHAAKFSAMYNEQVKVPCIVRTPMGGKRGYGPTHSQSLERLFLSCPGTRVLCLQHRLSPRLLYRKLFETIDRPTLVVENKTLYGAEADPRPPAGYALRFSEEDFPVANLCPQTGSDVTIVAIGGMSVEAEEASRILFEEHEIVADLFFPSQLYPFDAGFLFDSVRATRRLLVVEEGQAFASISSEILAQIAEALPGAGVRCGRLAAAERPLPSARPLEALCLPDAAGIARRVLELVR